MYKRLSTFTHARKHVPTKLWCWSCHAKSIFELLVGAGVDFLKHKQSEALQTSAVPEQHEAYIIGW